MHTEELKQVALRPGALPAVLIDSNEQCYMHA